MRFVMTDKSTHLCKRYPSIFTLLLRALLPSRFRKIFSKRLDHYEMRDLPEDRVTDDIPLSGCFMLVDTPTFRKVKGFDTDIPYILKILIYHCV